MLTELKANPTTVALFLVDHGVPRNFLPWDLFQRHGVFPLYSMIRKGRRRPAPKIIFYGFSNLIPDPAEGGQDLLLGSYDSSRIFEA